MHFAVVLSAVFGFDYPVSRKSNPEDTVLYDEIS